MFSGFQTPPMHRSKVCSPESGGDILKSGQRSWLTGLQKFGVGNSNVFSEIM